MQSIDNLYRFLPVRLQATPTKPIFTPPKTHDIDVSCFKGSFLTKYNKPSTNGMLVIIPFFNPCNSMRLIQNLLFIQNKLQHSSIPYVIPHCLFPDDSPIMETSEQYFTVKTNSYAFLKENLANIAIERYNDKYSKFVVLDGDIIFENKKWYDDLSNELNKSDIVQPYSEYKMLNSNFSCQDLAKPCVSVFSAFNRQTIPKPNDIVNENVQGHPGYVIAFTKKYLCDHGYPDEAVIGGGDTLTCSIALKRKLFQGHTNSKFMLHLYNKYSNDKEIRSKSLKGTIYHLYHNINRNRQYTTRYLILDKYINDETPYETIDDIIYKNDDGVYEWIKDIRQEINNDVLDYFTSRQDDEIAVI